MAAVEERQLSESDSLRYLMTGERVPRKETTVKKHTCIECGRTFDKPHGLRIHMARAHKAEEPRVDDGPHCNDIDECREDVAHTPCGADPCDLVADEAAEPAVSLEERLEPYTDTNVTRGPEAYATFGVSVTPRPHDLHADLLDTKLRLLAAIIDLRANPTLKADLMPLVDECRKLVR